MKIGVLVFARMDSRRLRGKALRIFNGQPALYWLYRQLRELPYPLIICTSTNSLDDAIEDFCCSHGIECFRGSEKNVLDRMYRACKQYSLDYVVRVTGDDLFVDPRYLVRAISKYDRSAFCYTDLPKGTDFQIVSAEFIKSLVFSVRTEDTEYLTWYFNNGPTKQFLRISPVGSPTYSFELDTEEDARRVELIISSLSGTSFKLEELLAFAEKNKQFFETKEVVDYRIEEIDNAARR